MQRKFPRFVLETIEASMPQGGVIAPMTGTIIEVNTEHF